MSLCWEYTCKKCGKAFDTMHPDPTRICGSCWRKLTEEARQAILPGATPIATTPTNEPKMPEVIYGNSLSNFFHASPDKLNAYFGKPTTYHHDDKVRELKNALKDCVTALQRCKDGMRIGFKPSIDLPIIEAALTKASNLLK